MADQSCAKGRAGPIRQYLPIKRRRNDILLIAWIGRGSHDCRDVGKGANGGVSREIEAMG
jgi:hypothetical protein